MEEHLPSILIAFVGLLMVLFLRGRRARAAQTPRTRGKSWSVLLFFVPLLITGGPMFIAIPAALYAMDEPTAPVGFAYFAFAGGAALSVGLSLMFGIIMRQMREIDSLRTLVEESGT